jgi:hypothetical protein
MTGLDTASNRLTSNIKVVVLLLSLIKDVVKGLLTMKYRIVLSVYGGEYCLGTTNRETVDYWSNRSNNELVEHITGDTIKDIPDEFYLFPFFDQTDVIHTNGVEVNNHNYLEVVNEESQETVYEVSLGSLREQMQMIDNPLKELDEGQLLIYTVSSEKGSYEYPLETDTFDPKNLRFFLHQLDETLVIDHIEYDDMVCDLTDGSTRGVSFSASFGKVYDDGKQTNTSLI